MGHCGLGQYDGATERRGSPCRVRVEGRVSG